METRANCRIICVSFAECLECNKQPFKHRIYSVGVIYLAIMNLPRNIRFKRENIIIVGLLPGPKEPSKNINSFLFPLVCELLSLWEGVSLNTYSAGSQIFRCALLCVGCDLPAGRKTCGFLSYTVNLGCSRCYCNFGTGLFGKRDYSGFEREKWTFRSNARHRMDVKLTLACRTKTVREQKESELGCRHSCLLKLPILIQCTCLLLIPCTTFTWVLLSIFCKRFGIKTTLFQQMI